MTLGPISTLFVDIGGVLLTNGWDRTMRRNAAEKFGIDYEEMNERHHLTFDTYEEGKLTLDEYLKRVVFHEKRAFAPGEFKDFMFQQSKAFPETIEMVRNLRKKHGLKVVAVSNEGRELTIYRREHFKLAGFIDFFVVSCFIHVRKPDADIYRMALDSAQVSPHQVLYLEDREMFVEIAQSMGINAIHHSNAKTTQSLLPRFGLTLED